MAVLKLLCCFYCSSSPQHVDRGGQAAAAAAAMTSFNVAVALHATPAPGGTQEQHTSQ